MLWNSCKKSCIHNRPYHFSHITPLTLPKSNEIMEERTLMQDICEVVQLANGSRLSDDFWGNATPLLERLGRRLDLTPVQTMLFAVLIELSDDRKIVLKQLAEFLGCRKVELLNHAADFEELIRRQLIRRRRSGSAEPDTYRVPKWYSKRCRPERNSLRPRSAALRSTNFSCDWGN